MRLLRAAQHRTSLFIVGSSTYAQLLIVICMVAALSEVVTHNVPFLYFEVSSRRSLFLNLIQLVFCSMFIGALDFIGD